MSRLVLSTAALLALSPAFAFTGEGALVGSEPVRVHHVNPGTQGQLYTSAPWVSFTEGEGQGWLARFDELTGTPRRIWGPGIAMDTASEGTVLRDLDAFLARHGDLHGQADLKPRSANYIERVDTWFVDYDVMVEGIPVWRGGVTARIKHGNLIMLGLETYPRTLLEGERRIDMDTARKAAVSQGPAPAAMHDPGQARLVWLPQEVAGGVVLQLVWEVRSETYKPVGQWVSFVDAETGELLHWFNEVRFATVEAEHDVRTVNGDFTISPLPYLDLGADQSALDGTFVDGGLMDGLSGEYFDVRNSSGAEASADITRDRVLTDADATQAELSTYVFLNRIREWGAANAPEVGLVDERSYRANVNIDDVCNAYYDGRSVNFYRSGQGCNNTGRIADVVFHEWGHGFHQYSLQAGTFDGAVSEGIGDIVSFLQTDDSVMAPYFSTGGSGIREVERDRVYPDDVVGEVHADGLIFGGAIWDMWKLARAEYGEEVGTQITTDVFTGLIKGGPSLDTVYDEAIVADDDDGDLSNGTPNQCLIIDGFLPHGLGPAGGSGLAIPVHDPIEVLLPDTDNVVETDLVNLAPACVSANATGGTLHFKINQEGWQSVPATVTGSAVDATLPARPAGTYVSYYLEVETDDAGSTVLPAGGEINPFTAYVGDVLEVYCNDFEEDDGSFGHRLLEGEEVEGADDWQWGVPAGLSGDPSAAYSGDRVWGNDLGGGEYNGAYQPERVNQLFSPALDTRHYLGTFLQYQRWLNVEDGLYDQAIVYADNEPVWSNWTTADGEDHHQDNVWAPHAISLGTAGDDGSVSVAWEIRSDGGLEFGGWTIDDVCLYAPDTPDNRLGVADFAASDDGEGRIINLTWTNPLHAPVERLKVVRKSNDYPVDHQDGRTILDTDEIELGAAMQVEDKVRKGTYYYYAVYAYDGENWLSWTRPGFNADFGITGEEAGGCGCQSTTPAGGWLGLALVGLIPALRRRRS